MTRWTEAENTYLREHYVDDGAAACALTINRPLGAVMARAAALKLTRVRRWSPADDDLLRVHWGYHSVPETARLLNRTAAALFYRAGELGIGYGMPQGFVSLATAAKQAGFSAVTLRRILEWARVRLHRVPTRPDRKEVAKGKKWMVEPVNVELAVTKWLELETLESACIRHGISAPLLTRLVLEAVARGEARVPPKPKPVRSRSYWRLPSAVVDDIVAAHRRKETLRAASLRIGVTETTLRVWLREAGVSYSRLTKLDPEVVDRIAAEKRSAGCNAWRKTQVAA